METVTCVCDDEADVTLDAPSAQHLGHNIAPEERAEHKALLRLAPPKIRSHGEYGNADRMEDIRGE